MQRNEIRELHYIVPVTNLPSIVSRGILSHRLARSVAHDSVALGEIQERRDRVRIPGGGWLHDYVNLYFHARNPMMYRRKKLHADLCVLRVKLDVLDLSGVVVTDCNASVAYVRFSPAPDGLAIVDRELESREVV